MIETTPGSNLDSNASRIAELQRSQTEEISRNRLVMDAVEGNHGNEENLALLKSDPEAYFNEVIRSQELLEKEGWNSPEQMIVNESIKAQAREAIRQINEIKSRYAQEIADLEK